MIIDAHAHIYPDKVAAKAVESIGRFYDREMKIKEGTVGGLLQLGDEAGVDKFLVHSVATTPAQIDGITKFIGSAVATHPDRLIGFTSSHPESRNIANEVEYAISLGLKGIKLHPDFQQFDIDSPDAMKIYEVIEGRLPVLLHTGDFRTQFSKPERILNIIKKFPRLTVIAAHFGGWSEWERAAEILSGTGVYVDTSSTQGFIDSERVRRLMDAYGEDYCIFGSDYPMWKVGDELEMITKLFNSEEEKEKILHKNIEKVLKL